jgi:phosphate transport system permease protein
MVAVLQANVSRGAFNKLDDEKPFGDRSRDEVYGLIVERLLKPKVVENWSLVESLTQREEIERFVAEEEPQAKLEFVSWLTPEFVSRPQSSEPMRAGVRTAILGSLLTISITVAFAFPIGVGAAVYLEEYARDNAVNRLIQMNINNLAGCRRSSMGFSVWRFRARHGAARGRAIFGLVEDPTTANGRTIPAAGLTLALLVLPLVIINAQEALKAVPDFPASGRRRPGATKWQTIRSHVLPAALPWISPGRSWPFCAFGETAPLVVIGASTYISKDPSGLFSKFTALPIQIYQWRSRPQSEFWNLAAASIVVLLVLLLAINAAAVLLRNRYGRQAELL